MRIEATLVSSTRVNGRKCYVRGTARRGKGAKVSSDVWPGSVKAIGQKGGRRARCKLMRSTL